MDADGGPYLPDNFAAMRGSGPRCPIGNNTFTADNGSFIHERVEVTWHKRRPDTPTEPLLTFEWENWALERVRLAESRAGEARRSEPLMRTISPARSRAWDRQSLAAPSPEPARR